MTGLPGIETEITPTVEASPIPSPEGELVIGAFARLGHQLRERKLERLHRSEDFYSKLSALALSEAGAEIPETGEVPIPPRPSNPRQWLTERKVLGERRKFISKVGKAEELKKVAPAAARHEKGREKLREGGMRVPITSKWVRQEKRGLKEQLREGSISKLEYNEKVDHINHLKPQGSVHYGNVAYRRIPEGEDPKIPLTKHEKKTKSEAAEKRDSIKWATWTEGLHARITKIEEDIPEKLKKAEWRHERWQERKEKAKAYAKKVPARAKRSARERYDYAKWVIRGDRERMHTRREARRSRSGSTT